jgi:hypothetical protein
MLIIFERNKCFLTFNERKALSDIMDFRWGEKRMKEEDYRFLLENLRIRRVRAATMRQITLEQMNTILSQLLIDNVHIQQHTAGDTKLRANGSRRTLTTPQKTA